MSDLKTQFEQAAREAQNLAKRPDNDVLLKLYALYKQATNGDVSGKKPGMFDMVGQAKYDAWSKLKGMTPTKAMEEYVSLVTKLKG